MSALGFSLPYSAPVRSLPLASGGHSHLGLSLTPVLLAPSPTSCGSWPGFSRSAGSTPLCVIMAAAGLFLICQMVFG